MKGSDFFWQEQNKVVPHGVSEAFSNGRSKVHSLKMTPLAWAEWSAHTWNWWSECSPLHKRFGGATIWLSRSQYRTFVLYFDKIGIEALGNLTFWSSFLLKKVRCFSLCRNRVFCTSKVKYFLLHNRSKVLSFLRANKSVPLVWGGLHCIYKIWHWSIGWCIQFFSHFRLNRSSDKQLVLHKL